MTEQQQNDFNDDAIAGLSSASACIDISIYGITKNGFKPVYTHQCFEGEFIPGYEPSIAAVENAISIARNIQSKSVGCDKNQENDPIHISNIPHSSFRNHSTATHHLTINIILSPSCRQCYIILTTEEKSRESACDDNSNTYNRETKKCKLIENHPIHHEVEHEHIISKLQLALPTIITSHINEIHPPTSSSSSIVFNNSNEKESDGNHETASPNEMHQQRRQKVESDFLSEPYGNVIYEYKRKLTRNSNIITNKDTPTCMDQESKQLEEEATFVLCLASGKDEAVKDYHDQVQKLSLWFIETADCVDISSDEGGGSWNVLYLFHKHIILDSSHNECYRYSLAGYFTLFSFHSPFYRKQYFTTSSSSTNSTPSSNEYCVMNNGGVIVRICQALIFPMYQRMGHGKVILRAIYETIPRENYIKDIVEINVEDPAPAFVALRNRFDYEMLNELLSQTSVDGCVIGTGTKFQLSSNLSNPGSFETIPELDTKYISSCLKITNQQVQIAYEIFKLKSMHEYYSHSSSSSNSIDGSDKETLEKQYRLMVKKRLNQLHKEDISSCATKEEKQKMLANLFDQTYVHYCEILGIPT